MGTLYIVMMRMLCLRVSLQSEDNICGNVDRPLGMVVNNKSEEDETMQGHINMLVHMLV